MSKLAIIIPYYKITFFEECLKSLLVQTNKNFNVYIGNDNSPNDPEELITRYSKLLPITYKKFSDNLGGFNLVKQWDRCIEMSNEEEWIMILGDDDTLDMNVVEEFYRISPNLNGIELIRVASQEINEVGEPITKVYYNPELELAKKFFLRCQKGNGRCSLSEHFFTRKTYEIHRFKNFSVAFGSDHVAWLEFSNMQRVYAINTALVNVRISNESLSANNDRKLGFKRVEGYYQYFRYTVSNLGNYFSVDEKAFILNKAYFYLRVFNRNNLKAFEFILFMINSIGFKRTIKIIKGNRYRNDK